MSIMNDESVIIYIVSEDGLAAAAGVRVGDKLVWANGINVRYDYDDAVDTLESSSNIALVLGREKIVEPKQEEPKEEEESTTGFAAVSFEQEQDTEVYGEVIYLPQCPTNFQGASLVMIVL